jgi:hypothetical protein
MFADAVTRAVFMDVRQVPREGGLFLFHVNARDDRPLRERSRPVVREIEADYVRDRGTSRATAVLSRSHSPCSTASLFSRRRGVKISAPAKSRLPVQGGGGAISACLPNDLRASRSPRE